MTQGIRPLCGLNFLLHYPTCIESLFSSCHKVEFIPTASVASLHLDSLESQFHAFRSLLRWHLR